MPRVHLVDATYELFRSFFGAPSLTAPDGREVGATRGLLRSMAGKYDHLSKDELARLLQARPDLAESIRSLARNPRAPDDARRIGDTSAGIRNPSPDDQQRIG